MFSILSSKQVKAHNIVSYRYLTFIHLKKPPVKCKFSLLIITRRDIANKMCNV